MGGDAGERMPGSAAETQGEGGSVTESRVIWKPSEAEQAMGIILSHYERNCGNAAAGGTGGAASSIHLDQQSRVVVEAGRAHLSCLKAQRKLLEQVGWGG